MISLANGIGSIGVMVRSPEQTGPSRGLLPFEIFRVAFEARIRRFVDYTEDSLVLHRHKIRPHHVVMGKIHYAVSGESAQWERKKQGCASQDRQSHHHPKIAADISTIRSEFARGTFIHCQESASHRPVAGHATHGFSREERLTGPWLQRRRVRKLVYVQKQFCLVLFHTHLAQLSALDQTADNALQ